MFFLINSFITNSHADHSDAARIKILKKISQNFSTIISENLRGMPLMECISENFSKDFSDVFFAHSKHLKKIEKYISLEDHMYGERHARIPFSEIVGFYLDRLMPDINREAFKDAKFSFFVEDGEYHVIIYSYDQQKYHFKARYTDNNNIAKLYFHYNNQWKDIADHIIEKLPEFHILEQMNKNYNKMKEMCSGWVNNMIFVIKNYTSEARYK